MRFIVSGLLRGTVGLFWVVGMASWPDDSAIKRPTGSVCTQDLRRNRRLGSFSITLP